MRECHGSGTVPWRGMDLYRSIAQLDPVVVVKHQISRQLMFAGSNPSLRMLSNTRSAVSPLGCVDEHETVGCWDEEYRDRLKPDIVNVVEHLERLGDRLCSRHPVPTGLKPNSQALQGIFI